jgi:hypothetical protein
MDLHISTFEGVRRDRLNPYRPSATVNIPGTFMVQGTFRQIQYWRRLIRNIQRLNLGCKWHLLPGRPSPPAPAALTIDAYTRFREFPPIYVIPNSDPQHYFTACIRPPRKRAMKRGNCPLWSSEPLPGNERSAP